MPDKATLGASGGAPEDRTAILRRRPARTRIRILNVRKIFPPDDELATIIARLCILREDLSLEIHGIVFDPMEFLDRNSIPWRHNYFFRNSVRTLMEIRGALQTLNCNVEFKRILKRCEPKAQEYFKEFCKRINEAHGLIEEVRNSIGAHVKHNAVGRGLKSVPFERTGVWEESQDFIHTHHRFSNELFIAILQGGDRPYDVPDKDITEVLEMTGTMARLTEAIPLIDMLFRLYLHERHLL